MNIEMNIHPNYENRGSRIQTAAPAASSQQYPRYQEEHIQKEEI